MAQPEKRKLESGKGYKNKSLVTGIESLFWDDITADVHFTVENDRIPAHKILLAARSDVFKAMFYGDMKEEGDIKIVDAKANAFGEFLQFFYLEIVELSIEYIAEVMNLIKKYMMPAALNICEEYIKDNCTIENVCFFYGLTVLFELENSKNICEKCIATNAKAVLTSKDFLNFDRSTLSNIFDLVEYNCSAVEIFHALISWTKTQSNQPKITRETRQEHIDDLFLKINFGSMKLEEFVTITSQYENLFSYEEYQDVVQIIASKEYQPKIFKKPVGLWRVWDGELEWYEGEELPADSAQRIPCRMTAENDRQEIRSYNWPQRLLVQLLPKQLVSKLGRQFQIDSKVVTFHLSSCPSLDGLIQAMSYGFVGCTHTIDCRLLFLFYSADKNAFLGFIPNDQAGTLIQLRKVLSEERNSITIANALQ